MASWLRREGGQEPEPRTQREGQNDRANPNLLYTQNGNQLEQKSAAFIGNIQFISSRSLMILYDVYPYIVLGTSIGCLIGLAVAWYFFLSDGDKRS